VLKTETIALVGKDAGQFVTLRERPALVADRLARAALAAVDADPTGGVVDLVFRHMDDVNALGPAALDLLQPFVDARALDGDPLDVRRLRDWRSVTKLQRAALLLHVGFLVGRPRLEIPVRVQAEMILTARSELAVNFCSPQIAVVLQEPLATYRELETDLSTEDVFNLVELINVRALREIARQSRTERA
jgi:hypothetical protein